MHILGQKEAIWNTLLSIFERWRPPKHRPRPESHVGLRSRLDLSPKRLESRLSHHLMTQLDLEVFVTQVGDLHRDHNRSIDLFTIAIQPNLVCNVYCFVAM